MQKIRYYASLRREMPDAKEFDGVGLIKGEHSEMVEHISSKLELKRLENYLSIICANFEPKPVWYRTNDASTKFVNRLNGTQYDEQNPHFGLRGIRRAIIETKDFIAEIKTIQKVRKQHKNLNILFPMSNDVRQYITAKALAKGAGYDGRIGIMAETPACVLTLDDYYVHSVDYIVFGMNDLTDCIDGCSRKNSTNKLIHRDESLRAAKKILSDVVWKSDIEYVLSGDFEPETIKLLKEFPFNAVAIPYTLTQQKNYKKMLR